MRYCNQWFIVVEDRYLDRDNILINEGCPIASKSFHDATVVLDLENNDTIRESIEVPGMYLDENEIFPLHDVTTFVPGVYILSVNTPNARNTGRLNEYIRSNCDIFSNIDLSGYFDIRYNNFNRLTKNHLAIRSYNVTFKNKSSVWCCSEPIPMKAYCVSYDDDIITGLDIYKIIGYYYQYINYFYLKSCKTEVDKKAAMKKMKDKVSALFDKNIKNDTEESFIDYVIFDEFVTKDISNSIEEQQKSIWDNPQDIIDEFTKGIKGIRKNIRREDMEESKHPLKIKEIGVWDGSKIVWDDNKTIGELMNIDLFQKEIDHMANILKAKTDSLIMWSVPKIKEVKFNYPATIVFWKDGTKTMVKLQEGDIFDSDKAIAMCFMKKMFFNEGKYYNEIKKHSIYKVKEKEFECPKCHKGTISPGKHDIIDLSSCSGNSEIIPPMDTVWKGKCNVCGFESHPARTKEDAILLIKDTITKYKKSHKNKKETRLVDKITQDNDPEDACCDRDIVTDLTDNNVNLEEAQLEDLNAFEKWINGDDEEEKEDVDKDYSEGSPVMQNGIGCSADVSPVDIDEEEKEDVDKDYSEGSPVMQNGIGCSADVSPVDIDEEDNKAEPSENCKAVDCKWEAISFKGGSPEGEFSLGRFIWTDNNLDTYYSHGQYQYKFDPSNFEWYPVTWYTDKDEDMNDAVGSFDAEDIWKDDNNIYYSYGPDQYELDLATHKWKPKKWERKSFMLYGHHIWTDGKDIYYSGLSKDNQYILKDKSRWEKIEWEGDLKNIDGHYIWSDGTNTYYGKGIDQYIFDKQHNRWNPIIMWHEGDKCSNYAIYGCAVWTDGENIYYSDNNYATYILEKGRNIWAEVSWADNEAMLLDGRDIWRHGGNIYHSHGEEHHRLQKLMHYKKWTASISSTPEIGKSIFTDTLILSKAVKDSNATKVYDYILPKEVKDSNVTKVYDYAWKDKEWSGLDKFEGDNIWSDGNHVFYSNGSQQYILNKETSTWEKIKMFTDKEIYTPKHTNIDIELKLFRENIWTDGTDIYYSDLNLQYELIKNITDVPHQMRWVPMKWKGLDIFNGSYIWKDGNDIYYSDGNKSYILDKQNHSWSIKKFKGYKVYGDHIWTDGTNVYYSNLEKQYILDRSTCTWNEKQWEGSLSKFDSKNIWTDGNDIYYSLGYENQKVLDKSTSTWKDKFWIENGNFPSIGSKVWKDKENIYYTTDRWATSIVLEKVLVEHSKYRWKDISNMIDTNTRNNNYPIMPNIYGEDILKYNGDIYCIFSGHRYKLNKDKDRWEEYQIYYDNGSIVEFDISKDSFWIDDKNCMFYSYSKDQQYKVVVNNDSMIFIPIKWNGIEYLYGDYIWTDGNEIYYNWGDNDYDSYVLDSDSYSWYPMNWGDIKLDGRAIWKDGKTIYYSNTYPDRQAVLEKGEWKPKTWKGLENNKLYYHFIWTDGTDIYFSDQYIHYKLDRSSDTWVRIKWANDTSVKVQGFDIWSDGKNIFYSKGKIQYVLEKVEE